MQWISPYLTRTMLIVLGLGLASGLPYLLVGATLGAWLQDVGIDKTTIGVFAWVAIPYSFNFLWAPFIDHVRLPVLHRLLGRRRSWMVLAQLGVIGTILLMQQFNPLDTLLFFACSAVLLAFFSATQDVVIDAYRAEILPEKDYGNGAAAAVFGYRLGMLMAGAGALALAETIDWQLVYCIMAALMGLTLLITLMAREPKENRHCEERQRRGSRSAAKTRYANLLPSAPMEIAASAAPPRNDGLRAILRTAIIEPFRDFMQRHPQWCFILAFILAYRIPDGFIGFMVTPFLLDIGFEKIDIAAIAKLYGFSATLLGMFLGGGLIRRFGIQKCLLWFLLLQIVTNLAYIGLAMHGDAGSPDTRALIIAVSLDNLSGGMITGVAIAYMMSLVNKAFTATQYALLASLASFSSKVLAGSAGIIADHYGWAMMFGVSALMGIPALWLLRKIK